MKKQKDRPHNGGQWTAARYRSFIVGLLRQGHLRWGPKYTALKRAYVGPGINPETGRRCKLHRCEMCMATFPLNAMRVDHINPVVDPVRGFQGWDEYISRMFQESDGYRAICSPCHDKITARDNRIRLGKPARERKKRFS